MRFCSFLGQHPSHFVRGNLGKWRIKKDVSLNDLPLPHNFQKVSKRLNFVKIRERAYQIKDNSGKFTL